MNKVELITALAEKAEVSKKDAAAVLEAFTATITEESECLHCAQPCKTVFVFRELTI